MTESSNVDPQAELLAAIRTAATWASRLGAREAGTALQWAQAAHHLAQAHALLSGAPDRARPAT
jgi:hypothetical protein